MTNSQLCASCGKEIKADGSSEQESLCDPCIDAINLWTPCLVATKTTTETDNYEPKKQRRKLHPCFKCSKHFWGKSHVTMVNSIDGLTRKFHKQCAEEEKKENPTLWRGDDYMR